MDETHSPGTGWPTWLDPGALWEAWLRALGWRAPLSGDVTQAIDTSLIRSFGEQLGFININTTGAGDAQVERRIVEQVASYGRQLGRVLDAVDVLIRHDIAGELPAEDRRALERLQSLRSEIMAAKEGVAVERVDRLIADIHALRRDPEGNHAALQRVREALQGE
jgi:hypothetical protein